MDIKIIESPSSAVLRSLKERARLKEIFDEMNIGAVGLVQGKLVEMFVAMDIAEKAANVEVVEIRGICPQHFTMIAILGDTASVNEAADSVALTFNERRTDR